ncbi:MAG: BON domain-containing protein [Undibacterium sp.]|uniref:BON domain-containing protein n=1 Tax=Undibacterium sp. TaxID=1914977 RepID=UPI00271918BC|nr:BON domain-containing protein [Undibacterium sp.]MDO8654441.1 BON domain-containing protein [Undibacterium sp.]
MKTDVELQKDVLEELLWDPLVPEAKVGVAVSDGVVTLTGHLDTYEEKIAVRHAVERLVGVKAIAVELDVVPTGLHRRSDTEIAAAVDHALSWSTSVPRDQIKVMVEKGWITLSGELNWNFQRKAVERMIRPLKGVVGIIDNIHLKPMAAPSSLSSRIQDALTRQAVREAKRIEVVVDGSDVFLRGHVHSWAEKNAAEGAAWSAPGVTSVKNYLIIGP